MKLSYTQLPRAGEEFSLKASEVAARARFAVYLDGEVIATHECDDPPCYERFHIPAGSAGKTLLVVATDRVETRELMFFIKDDDRGVPMVPPKTTVVAPTAML